MVRRRTLYGKDLKFNQLVNKNSLPSTRVINGLTITNNGDGSLTINGTKETTGSTFGFYINLVSAIKKSHKVLSIGGFDGNIRNYFTNSDYSKWIYGARDGIISNTLGVDILRLRLYETAGIKTYSNRILLPQVIDLTAMYGAGNEPLSVNEVKADCLALGYDLSVYQPYIPI